MEDYLWILLIIGIAVIWGILSWVIETISNSKKYLELKPQLDNLEKDREELEIRVEEWNGKVKNDKKDNKLPRRKRTG